jgi:hypothetical protein
MKASRWCKSAESALLLGIWLRRTGAYYLKQVLVLRGTERTGTRSDMCGCGWRRGHGATTTHLFTCACPSSAPLPPTQLSKRICGAPTSAKSVRRATSSSPLPLVRRGWGAGTREAPPRTTHHAGGLPQGSSCFLGQPWLRPRDPKHAYGVAQQRRCRVDITRSPSRTASRSRLFGRWDGDPPYLRI